MVGFFAALCPPRSDLAYFRDLLLGRATRRAPGAKLWLSSSRGSCRREPPYRPRTRVSQRSQGRAERSIARASLLDDSRSLARGRLHPRQRILGHGRDLVRAEVSRDSRARAALVGDGAFAVRRLLRL